MWRVVSIVVGVMLLCGTVVITGLTVGRADVTRVIFLDIGQGDGILITRGTHQVLIDGGADRRRLLEHLGRFMPFWDRTIELMIATHPDADHIGGQIGVFDAYHVATVLATDAFKKSHIATAWHSALERSRARVIMADESVVVRLERGNDAAGVLRVLFPRAATDVRAIRNVNDTSIVTLFTVGATSFLLTGDLTTAQEGNIRPGHVTVLKVGHHGSRFSTGEALLAHITPRDAVISVGAHNRYGHPTQEVLARLAQHNVRVLRTDLRGTIIYTCTADGCALTP